MKKIIALLFILSIACIQTTSFAEVQIKDDKRVIVIDRNQKPKSSMKRTLQYIIRGVLAGAGFMYVGVWGLNEFDLPRAKDLNEAGFKRDWRSFCLNIKAMFTEASPYEIATRVLDEGRNYIGSLQPGPAPHHIRAIFTAICMALGFIIA